MWVERKAWSLLLSRFFQPVCAGIPAVQGGCVLRAIVNTHYAIVNTLTRDREHSLCDCPLRAIVNAFGGICVIVFMIA